MMRLFATQTARCAVGIALCALAAGCADLRRPVMRANAAPPLATASVAAGTIGLTLSPARMVAPIGSEVVMIAATHGPRGVPLVGQPVEWMLARDGVGQFLTAAPRRSLARFAGVDDTPQKIDNTYARGHTSRDMLVLRRGTADPGDDVAVRRGEAWISITSPTTGTSYVTCYGPAIAGWQQRHQTAQIYWIDAQFSFPPPAIGAAGGSQTISTTVTRQSDQAPLAGWLVRYEIGGGPAAGFGADAAQVIEVETNPQGQAIAEISQMAPAAGTNEIRIQIVRPANAAGGPSRPFIAATGTTQVTWSAADVSIQTTGPAVSRVGAEATYRFTVTNRGDLRATGVVVSQEIPPGMTHLSSQPAAQRDGARGKWTLGALGPGESRTIEVTVRTTEQGTFNFCGEVTTAEGLTSRSCTPTVVAEQLQATVEIDIRGPTEAVVGDRVTYEIVVTNRGTATATGLRVSDAFPAGLKHDVAVSPIERRTLVDLAPGQQTRVTVTFTVVEAGEHCHDVTVTGDGGLLVTKRACLRATAAAPAARREVSAKITPPVAGRVGDLVRFTVEVVNTGNVALRDVAIKVVADRALETSAATGGFTGMTDLTWLVDRLDVGVPKRVRIEYKCLQTAAEACVQVEVGDGGESGVLARDRQCLRIDEAQNVRKPAMDDLSLKIAERTSPVKVGGTTVYEVFVKNLSDKTFHDVRVRAIVPEEMTLQRATIAQVQGNEAEFAVAALLPGEEIRFQVHVTAKQPGNARFVVRLSSREHAEPLEAVKMTLVFAERQ